MTPEILYVFAVIAGAGVLFATGRVRLDIVALLVVLALYLGGILSVGEALAGFGNPVVVMVGGLLVIGDMLTRAGVAHAIGEWLTRVGGGSESRLLILLTLTVAVLGCFMSNTAVVAIFIPVVFNIAARSNLNASRLLLPLAYAGLISGMLTLIATPPNLVASAELERSGYEPFGFFSVTPVGLAVLLAFLGYMLVLGRRLLPGEQVAPPKSTARTIRDLLDDYALYGTARRLRIRAGSPLQGRTLTESKLGARYPVRVLILEQMHRLGTRIIAVPGSDTDLRVGDVLVVLADEGAVLQLVDDLELEELPVTDVDREQWTTESGLATVLIHPESRLIGSTIRESRIRLEYGIQVMGLRRKGELLESFVDEKLAFGDAMLVIGPWKRIAQLQSSLHDFVVLALPVEIEQVAPARHRAPVALLILVGMVALSALEIVPVAIAVLMAVLAAVFTGCQSMKNAYSAIHWSTLVLIAGLLPIADAMIRTGGVDLIVEKLISCLGSSGPYVMMTALFLLTTLLGTALSNTATTVLVVPIAIRAAEAMQLSPHAFAMAVAIAASSAYATPVSSPATALVVEPGNYRFGDFVKAGLPVLLLTLVVSLLVIPLVFPFHG